MLLARTGDGMEISGRLLFRLVKARARSITMAWIFAFDAESKGGVQRRIINVFEVQRNGFPFVSLSGLVQSRSSELAAEA